MLILMFYRMFYSPVLELLNNFSSKVLCLVFLFSKPNEMRSLQMTQNHENSVQNTGSMAMEFSEEKYVQDCKVACSRAFVLAKRAGYKSIIVSYNTWMKKAVQPMVNFSLL